MDRVRELIVGLGRHLTKISSFERVVVSVLSLLFAILIGSALVFFSGMFTDCSAPTAALFGIESCYSPETVLAELFFGAYSDAFSIAVTLQQTTLLIFTGISFALAFRAGLFNVGSQGQFIFGGLSAAVAVLSIGSLIPSGVVGGIILVSTGIIVGAAFGGAYGAIPGALKAYFETNEIITTLLLNFIASGIAFVLLTHFFLNPEADTYETSPIPGASQLPAILFAQNAAFSIIGLLLALVLALVFYVVLNHTKTGYDMRMSGEQPSAATFSGVNAKFNTMFSMTVSGALAGIGGAVWVMMVAHKWLPSVPAVGFDGIAVAILAGNSILGVLPAGLLFGTLKSGSVAVEFSTGVPDELVDILRGLIILFVAMPELFRAVGLQFTSTGSEGETDE